MSAKFNTTVLVAPLDWGLGHASRCIPIIRYLTEKGCNVIIATSGLQKQLLLTEFPNHGYVELSGYNISYSKSKRWFPLKILFQVPKILLAIHHEHKWLKVYTALHNVDAIISDNRYGLWHQKIPCAIITHQLSIQTMRPVQKLTRCVNYGFINRFSVCWVPDNAGTPNMAGKLAHPLKLPRILTTYLGGLSRFNKTGELTKRYDLLVVLSGPEPQRSLLEKLLLQQLQTFLGSVLFVRGLPGTSEKLPDFNGVAIKNHLPARDMGLAFEQSDYIVSRSGYTTVMDIIRLKKKSILIPTPGQTEQEFLAWHLQKQYWCLSFSQSHFNLLDAVDKAKKFPYKLPDADMEYYRIVLLAFLNGLSRPSE